MTDADREIKRLISYIRSCREANIDCTVTIDKRLTHCVLNALKEVQQYRKIGTVAECREAVEKQKPMKPEIHKDRFSNTYNCPKCGYVLIHRGETGWFCGQHYKFCPACGQAIQWEESEEE